MSLPGSWKLHGGIGVSVGENMNVGNGVSEGWGGKVSVEVMVG